MQHSQLINTEFHTRDAWIKQFYLTHTKTDYQRVAHAVDLVFEVTPKQDAKYASSLEVAKILQTLQVDQETLIAALLSDFYLLNLNISNIKKQFGEKVAILVKNVHCLHDFHHCDSENPTSLTPLVPQQAERLRQMLFALVDDIRAVLIKLAWRLQRLRTLDRESFNPRRCIAQETLDIFAPLANRLGISQLKWEMEDLAFRYLDPLTYKKIAKSLEIRRVEREAFIEKFTQNLKKLLTQQGVHAKVYGRAKHIYSIWRKMKRKNISIAELYDLRAVRVIVDNISTCYQVLDIAHTKWSYVREEFDDYISNKKSNGYQSLHTVITTATKEHVEIQIRTHDMHVFAELGVAAHWRYKEGGEQNIAMEKAITSFRQLLNHKGDDELLQNFHSEAFQERVFTFTPTGDVIDLPKGSTPLDFAYAIHTHIGHSCRGALVNGAMVALSQPLKNSDRVEILTGVAEAPKRNWMNPNFSYIVSSKARAHIRQWFHRQKHEQNFNAGKLLLEKEKHRLNLIKIDIPTLVKKFHRKGEREFFIALGRGDINVQRLTKTLIPPEESEKHFRKIVVDTKPSHQGIKVENVANILTHIAKCCQPVAGDAITGFITLGKGVSIHRKDCSNIVHLALNKKSQLINVSWGMEETAYAVDIRILYFQRKSILRDITQTLAKENVHILELLTKTKKNDPSALLDATIQVKDATHLGLVLEKLTHIPNVHDAKRR